MSTPAAAQVGARAADADDLVALTALAIDARAPLAEVRGGSALLTRDERGGSELDHLTRAIDHDDHLVTVGLVDDTVVGYVTVLLVHTPTGATVADIEELYVRPEARQIGVGTAMLEMVIGWAQHRGCTGIDAVALPGDRATKNFFEGHGLVARAIIAHRSLDGTGSTP